MCIFNIHSFCLCVARVSSPEKKCLHKYSSNIILISNNINISINTNITKTTTATTTTSFQLQISFSPAPSLGCSSTPSPSCPATTSSLPWSLWSTPLHLILMRQHHLHHDHHTTPPYSWEHWYQRLSHTGHLPSPLGAPLYPSMSQLPALSWSSSLY